MRYERDYPPPPRCAAAKVVGKWVAVAALIVTTLTACGGGGGGGGSSAVPPGGDGGAPPPAPDTSFQNVAGFRHNGIPTQYRTEAFASSASRVVGASRMHWSQCISNCVGVNRSSVGGYIRGEGATIAIVDTGIDVTHSDLAENIVHTELNRPHEGENHGTQVAGIAAGAINFSGMMGVAPEAKIIPIAYLSDDAPSLLESYSHARTNNAFVVNNSWGPFPSDLFIRTTEELTVTYGVSIGVIAAGSEIGIRLPAVYDETDPSRYIDPTQRYGISRSGLRNAIGDMLMVFAHGNDGWNSESGQVEVFDASVTATVELSNYNFNTLIAVGYREDDTSSSFTRYSNEYTLAFNENTGDYLSQYPIRYDSSLRNQWINVVALDGSYDIAYFSNGCGETRDFCVAAPGGFDIAAPQAGGGLANIQGTSAAAPHVTGMAALLKGAFPNLTASQAQNIILETADGMGSCETVPIYITCTDDVYGHGAINVSNAFTPHGDLFGGSGLSQTAIDSSRIVLSRSFADAPWRETNTNIGALDQYGRVFYANLDLNHGVVITKPETTDDNAADESEHELAISGAAIHRVIAPPLHTTENRFYSARVYDTVLKHYGEFVHNADDFNFARQQYGNYFAYETEYIAGGKNRFVWQHHAGDPTHIPPAAQFARFYVPDFVSAERNNLQWTHRDGNTHFALLYEDGSATRQLATRLSYGAGNWRVFAEGGIVNEDRTILGATYSGIYQTGDAATRYQRLGLSADFADGFGGGADNTAPKPLRVFADYVRAQTRAGNTGGIVRAFNSRADKFASGVAYGNWTFSYSLPMAVTAGTWQWEYIDGYNPDGSYRSQRTDLDLASQRREHIFGVQYENKTRTARARWHYSVGADYINRAADRGYQADTLNINSAIKIRF